MCLPIKPSRHSFLTLTKTDNASLWLDCFALVQLINKFFLEADRETYTDILVIYYFSQCLENVVTFYEEGFADLVQLYKLGLVNFFNSYWRQGRGVS